jgi:FolB domain-containing protein
MDSIHIRDLTLRCIIGIYPRERKVKQDVVINVTLEGDLRKAGRSDRIADTINYKDVKKSILRLVEGSSFNLIETLAERIAATCLATRGVKQATVTVDKPGALRYARSVAVEVKRKKNG